MATATATSSPARPETLSGKQAADRLGTTTYRIQKLAGMGRIRTVVVPGELVRFLAEDVERLVAELGRPASA